MVDLRSENMPDEWCVFLFLSFSPELNLIPLTAKTYCAIANIATNIRLFLTILECMFLFDFIVEQK
jgi:hypothetical protein